MSSFQRKLFCLFILNNLVLCSLTAQIPGLGLASGIIYEGLTKKYKPVNIFGEFVFNSNDAIIGVGVFDSMQNSSDRFSFIIDKVDDLNELKKSWKFKPVKRVKDKYAFNIYFTRDKAIQSSWVIFLESKAIATYEGHYNFDTALLSKLHAKNPLVYNVHFDTISNKNDLIRFRDSVTVNPSFLFWEEPNMFYQGSFDITLKEGSKMSIEDFGKRIVKRCNRIKDKPSFNVYLKEDGKTYSVMCSQFVSEQFLDPDMQKTDWAPARYVIKSYWRIN